MTTIAIIASLIAVWLLIIAAAIALIHGASKARTDLAEEIDAVTGRKG